MANFTKISGGIQKACAYAGFTCFGSPSRFLGNYLALKQLKPSSKPDAQVVLTRDSFGGMFAPGFKAGQLMLAFMSFRTRA